MAEEKKPTLSNDVKAIKNVLAGNEYIDGFIKKTKSRLMRIEVAIAVIIAFILGMVLGDIETLIRIFT